MWFFQKEEIKGSIYNSVAEGKLDLDSDVGAVVIGFDRDFNYDKIVIATCYLNNPDCLLLTTNMDEKCMVAGSPYHLPGNIYFWFLEKNRAQLWIFLSID